VADPEDQEDMPSNCANPQKQEIWANAHETRESL